MDKAIDILQFLRKRLHFADGLVVLLLAAEALYYGVVRAVGRDVVLLLNSLGCDGALGWCRAFYLLGFLLAPFIAAGFWSRIRSVPRFKRNELGILFAPNAAPATQDVIDRLFVHLRQEIKSHELGVRFHLKRLPPNLSLDSAEEATRMLRESRGVVAVWGPFEQQESADGKTTGFSKLSCSWS